MISDSDVHIIRYPFHIYPTFIIRCVPVKSFLDSLVSYLVDYHKNHMGCLFSFAHLFAYMFSEIPGRDT